MEIADEIMDEYPGHVSPHSRNDANGRAEEPTWLTYDQVDRHPQSSSFARFGGAAGLRDEGHACARRSNAPINKWHYEQARIWPTLAAAYAFGLAKNHAFVDGNKRIAFDGDDRIPAQERRSICA